MFSSNEENDHLRMMEKLLEVTQAENAHFCVEDSNLYTKELRIDRFVFSESGVVRDA